MKTCLDPGNRRPSWRLLQGGAIVLLLLFLPACTEADEQLLDSVGVTFLIVTDSGLRSQEVTAGVPDDQRKQYAAWELASATLDLGDRVIDLLFEEPCSFEDTAFVSPSAEGACASGVVIEAFSGPRDVELVLVLERMEVRRALPLDLSDPASFGFPDYDVDRVPNDRDNCPLLNNEDQADGDGDGVGNACVVNDFFLGELPDNDGDGDVDITDNCAWFSNPNQEDEGGASGLGDDAQPDNGVGDRCFEQAADVLENGQSISPLTLGPTTLTQVSDDITYLTVDFRSQDWDADACDWDAGACELDPGAVRFCTSTSLSEALVGCLE